MKQKVYAGGTFSSMLMKLLVHHSLDFRGWSCRFASSCTKVIRVTDKFEKNFV